MEIQCEGNFKKDLGHLGKLKYFSKAIKWNLASRMRIQFGIFPDIKNVCAVLNSFLSVSLGEFKSSI